MSGVVSNNSNTRNNNVPDWLGDGTKLEEHIRAWWTEQRQYKIPPSTFSFLVNLGFNAHKIQRIFKGSTVDLVPFSSTTSDLDVWWSQQVQREVPPSPFEFLVAHGWDLDKVSKFLLESVTDISRGKQSTGPGILAVVAKLCSDALSMRDVVSAETGYGILSDLLDRGRDEPAARSTEWDIMTVVEILPRECLYSPICKSTDHVGCQDIWEECLNCFFSNDLVEFMMRRFKREQLYLPPGTGSGGVGLDLLYMKAITHAIPSVTLLTIDCELWSKAGLVEFFWVLLKNKTVRTLKFYLTENIDALYGASRADLQAVMDSIYQLADGCHQECGVKDLDFTVGGEGSPLTGVLQVLVDANPGLEEMNLENGNTEKTTLMIAWTMNVRKLKRVKLRNSSFARWDPSPIFNALEQDTSLSHLHFNGTPKDPVSNAELLLYVLEQNASLEEVTLGWHIDLGMHPDDLIEMILIEMKIGYVLALNRCGRRKLRNPDTSLRDFVNMLDTARHDRAVGNPLDLLNVQYGLLLEAPSKWCHSTDPPPMQQASPDRKRKFHRV